MSKVIATEGEPVATLRITNETERNVAALVLSAYSSDTSAQYVVILTRTDGIAAFAGGARGVSTITGQVWLTDMMDGLSSLTFNLRDMSQVIIRKVM